MQVAKVNTLTGTFIFLCLFANRGDSETYGNETTEASSSLPSQPTPTVKPLPTPPIFTPLTQELIKNCPNSIIEVYTPSCTYGRISDYPLHPESCGTTKVLIGLWLERFHNVDVVAETFAVSGSVHFYWNVTCPFRWNYTDASIYIDENKFWKPRIYHQNAASDYGMDQQFTNRFLVAGLNDPLAQKMSFYLQHSGIFLSTSNMDVAKFPFDELQLELVFLIREKPQACAFSGFDLVQKADDFLSESSTWQFRSFTKEFATRYVVGANRSVALFRLALRRKPEFYVYNLMLPHAFLTFVEMAAFIMPPEESNRPVFAVTVLLALTFTEAELVRRTPEKPYRIFLSSYIDLCSILALLCTLYTLIACSLHHPPKYKVFMDRILGPKRFRLRLCRIADVVIFNCAFFFFIGTNIYAAMTAKSAGHF